MPVGTVIRWAADRGFGFVQPEGAGVPVFVHLTEARRSGIDSLSAGQRLEFEIAMDDRTGKPQAVGLKVLPWPAGTLSYYDAGRGYGFITPDAGGQGIFVHHSRFDRATITPCQGMRVEFITELDNKTGKVRVAAVQPAPAIEPPEETVRRW